MSKVSAIRDHIIGQIREVVPSFDPAARHTCIDDGTGHTPTLDDLVSQGRDRFFMLESNGAVEDGMTGVGIMRVRENLVVRSIYAQPGERTRRMAATDTLDLMLRLRNPANWGAVGIDAIVITDADVDESETEAGGLVVSRPLAVLYIED